MKSLGGIVSHWLQSEIEELMSKGGGGGIGIFLYIYPFSQEYLE
jgi:hypothetical protein